mmetsp:Transcript_17986/g.30618  ORF Transcript_17986/g.30618 Transcript_17986/m.30618 type:complete len:97 (-) Transcript_17986:848-1138(-)
MMYNNEQMYSNAMPVNNGYNQQANDPQMGYNRMGNVNMQNYIVNHVQQQQAQQFQIGGLNINDGIGGVGMAGSSYLRGMNNSQYQSESQNDDIWDQ